MLGVVRGILIAIEIVTCLLLVGVVLLQKTKGQGIGLAFGAAMGETLFGARAGNVLTRATVILAIIFLVNTTLIAVVGSARREAGSVTDDMDVPAPLPAAPGVPGMPAADLPAPDMPPAEDLPAADMPPPAAQPAPSVPANTPEPPAADLPAAPAG
ncbi:MAG: preprotein translocase subunit SecG [Lentisphaerae bacterium]|nr:preprotein translocase subunit SecG [Lentisphaerota bacterium]